MNSLKYTCFFVFSLLAQNCIGQDSLNMSRVGQWNPSGMVSAGGVTYNDVWGYTTSTGEEYAIVGNVDSILIVDISDCTDPTRIYGYDGGNTTTWRDFKTYGDYVYAVCDNCTEGLHIFDMSALPGGNVQHTLSTTAFFDEAHNIYIDEAKSKLYATGTDTAKEGVVILDLTTPSNPSLIENIYFDEEIGNPGAYFYVHDIYVKNDTAYASHGNKGFYIWDMSNLSDIKVLGSYDSPGYNHSSWINDAGTYAYYAEEIPRGQPMAIVDLANLGSMTGNISIVGTFRDPLGTANDVTPHNPFVKNDTLYISYYEDGLKAYDLSNPSSPSLIAYYDTYPDNGSTYTGYKGAWGTYPFFNSGCICISDMKYGLNIIKNCTTQNYYEDADMDRYGNSNVVIVDCTPPAGYVSIGGDCDDTDPNNFPGNAEFCDNADNDCDTEVDENSDITYYRDEDNDGFGNISEPTSGCIPITGYIEDSSDCDDGNAAISPAAIEICDGIDNNCDGVIDEGQPTNNYYLDSDNDNYGDPTNMIAACSQPSGYIADNNDCDDSNNLINPAATEVCDGIDNNCDGIIDEGCSSLPPCDDQNLTISTISQNIYRANNNINSNALINSNSNISFFAGTDLELNPNFEVALGGEFIATIANCDASNLIISAGPATIKILESFLASNETNDFTEFILYQEENGKIIKIGIGSISDIRARMQKSPNRKYLIVGIKK